MTKPNYRTNKAYQWCNSFSYTGTACYVGWWHNFAVTFWSTRSLCQYIPLRDWIQKLLKRFYFQCNFGYKNKLFPRHRAWKTSCDQWCKYLYCHSKQMLLLRLSEFQINNDNSDNRGYALRYTSLSTLKNWPAILVKLRECELANILAAISQK